jgi:hypothetical protein
MKLMIAAAAAAMVLLFALPAQAKCDKAPAPGSDPTAEELREAMRVAGVTSPPAGVYAVAHECLPGTLLGQYNARGIIVLAEDWRRVGGLTRLIHELRHHYQAEHGLPIDECDATEIASHWADRHDYVNEARRERAYGAAHCIGETG